MRFYSRDCRQSPRSHASNGTSRINHETWAYSILDHDYQQNTNSTRIAPKFLGHLTENGRVIGMLLEKLEGEFASIDDLPACSATLLKLHNIGLVHGDVNRYNFIVDRAKGDARLLDFERVEGFEEEQARLETESLPSEMTEETGRGFGHVVILEDREKSSGLGQYECLGCRGGLGTQ